MFKSSRREGKKWNYIPNLVKKTRIRTKKNIKRSCIYSATLNIQLRFASSPSFLSSLVPSSPPENVFVRTTNHSDLQITWSRVPSSAAHSVVIGYHVRVARENGKEIAIATCPFRANTSLSNLTVYQNYCVAVAAFSRRGIGPVSLRKCAVVDDGGIPTFFFNLCIFEFLCISFIFSREILQ